MKQQTSDSLLQSNRKLSKSAYLNSKRPEEGCLFPNLSVDLGDPDCQYRLLEDCEAAVEQDSLLIDFEDDLARLEELDLDTPRGEEEPAEQQGNSPSPLRMVQETGRKVEDFSEILEAAPSEEDEQEEQGRCKTYTVEALLLGFKVRRTLKAGKLLKPAAKLQLLSRVLSHKPSPSAPYGWYKCMKVASEQALCLARI